MPKFHLNWKSTPAERYDDGPQSMNLRAEQASGLLSQIFSREGGSDNMTADNALGVDVPDEKTAIEAAERISEAIGKVVTVVTEDFRQVHETKARFAPGDVSGMLAKVAEVIEQQGGRLSVTADAPSKVDTSGTRYLVGLEFGEESPGSSMYGGAAYGEGPDLETALRSLLADVGQ